MRNTKRKGTATLEEVRHELGSDVKVRYLRNYDADPHDDKPWTDLDKKPSIKGGITILIKPLEDKDGEARLLITAARCSTADNFSRGRGMFIAACRMDYVLRNKLNTLEAITTERPLSTNQIGILSTNQRPKYAFIASAPEESLTTHFKHCINAIVHMIQDSTLSNK